MAGEGHIHMFCSHRESFKQSIKSATCHQQLVCGAGGGPGAGPVIDIPVITCISLLPMLQVVSMCRYVDV